MIITLYLSSKNIGFVFDENLSFKSNISLLKNYPTNVLFNITQNPSYLPKCISSFKSTETALAKISSDILTNLDYKNSTILALLDLSSAFDTIDHTITIHRLTSIGITGTAHKWLSSFITTRTSIVLVHSTRSSSRLVTHGVPQGSVLGQILF